MASPRVASALAVTVALLGAPGAARACPDCDTARAARAQFFDDGFPRTLVTTLVPFAVIAVAAGAAHRSRFNRRP